MMQLLKTTEDKGRAGHRNFRLLFYAYSIGFAATLYFGLKTGGGVDAEVVRLYLYFCIFTALSQGLFTAKDVLNTLWHKKYSNGNGNGADEVASEKS